MNKRINVTLPDATVALLDRVSKKGQRSNLIDAAIKHYVKDKGRAELRKKLAEGYQKRAQEDLKMAAEWFPLEEEAWEKSRL